MGDSNASSSWLYVIFINTVNRANTINDVSNEQQNYSTTNDIFNKNCNTSMDCKDVAYFCDLSVHLCKCASFYSRNEDSRICEFQLTNLTHWMKSNQSTLNNSWLDNGYNLLTPYEVSWSLWSVIALSAIFLFLCAIFVFCDGHNEKNEPKVLCKEQEESRKIMTSIIEKY